MYFVKLARTVGGNVPFDVRQTFIPHSRRRLRTTRRASSEEEVIPCRLPDERLDRQLQPVPLPQRHESVGDLARSRRSVSTAPCAVQI